MHSPAFAAMPLKKPPGKWRSRQAICAASVFLWAMALVGLVFMAFLKPATGQSGGEDILLESSTGTPGPENAAIGPIPNYWDFKNLIEPPSTEGLGTVRFLMSGDFPPFSYRTPEERLAGFHVDLARALCAELDLSCIVLVHPFEQLEDALAGGGGEAIMAGLSIDKGLKSGFIFSDVYLTTPARFVMRRSQPQIWPSPASLKGRRVGVIEGSAHAAFLQAFFPEANAIFFDSRFAARREILRGNIGFLFDDGLSLSFWLNGEKSQNCCTFTGGPYTESHFFGKGFAIAFAKEQTQLKHSFNYALQQLAQKGIFAELYLRYFPVSFFAGK